MRKCVLLKIQLAEAAKYAAKDEIPYKRLAVIMLDNFIELQLSSLLKLGDFRGYIPNKQERMKYAAETRQGLQSYDKLIALSKKRGIIEEDERYMLDFCHTVRNNLYHHAKEEKLLMDVALRMLHDTIIKRQPTWKNASMGTAFMTGDEDPFFEKRRSGPYFMDYNSEKEWTEFLKKHFTFIDKKAPTIDVLLSQNILEKTATIRDYYKFLDGEYSIFYPYANDWGFNEFVMNYSFPKIYARELESINRIEDKEERENAKVDLHAEHIRRWKRKDMRRITGIEKQAKGMKDLSDYHALQRFRSLQPDLLLIYYSLENAVSDLDGAINLARDIARGK